ncbi:hypothetical protein OOK27_05560 [Streptomyces canus]|uniref:hypothetical protein n=1 Tax=Streptomyces canus TaxID=58343 RepID=UPI002259DEBE|nr:hypothetical protein [Streptomyces canus]MCX5253641.1 hypothetical protein [Streptomyces canus]
MTQISMEAAFPTFQKKCSELFDANMLLQAQLDVQERELVALREENERLKQGGPESAPGADPDLSSLRSVAEEG